MSGEPDEVIAACCRSSAPRVGATSRNPITVPIAANGYSQNLP